MPIITYQTALPVSASAAYDWHTRPGAFERLTPPWERAQLLDATFPFQNGTRWTFSSRLLGPLKKNWLVEHFNAQPGRQFSYRLLKGSFRKWEHTLRFIPSGEACTLENHIDYELPIGPFGAGYFKRRINDLFDYRARILMDDLTRHAMCAKLLTVAVTGSRGLIGTQLVNFLTTGGHRVVRFLSGELRKPTYDDGTDWRAWESMKPLPVGSLKDIDAVVHLAGDGIASGRWTKEKKQRIRESRVIPTKHLAEAIDRDGVPVFLSGSAVGYYGNRGDEVLTEASPPGSGFLAEVCQEWEAASQCHARTVNLRTAHVLWPNGGLLGKLLPSFRAGGGAVLGDGSQYMPWIGVHDYVYAIHHLLNSNIAGPVNLATPNPVTNRVFGRTLAKVLGRPFLLTLPRTILKALLGDMADEALLTGQRVMPAKLTENQFAFSSPDLETTLRFLLAKQA